MQILFQMKVREIQNSVERRRRLPRGQSLQNEQFDYEENAENDSSLSTPSNSYWDSPFAQDSLGDTAIHLDKVKEAGHIALQMLFSFSHNHIL